jgi:hypothetical protein
MLARLVCHVRCARLDTSFCLTVKTWREGNNNNTTRRQLDIAQSIGTTINARLFSAIFSACRLASAALCQQLIRRSGYVIRALRPFWAAAVKLQLSHAKSAPTPVLQHRRRNYICGTDQRRTCAVLPTHILRLSSANPRAAICTKYQRHPYCPRNRASIRSLRQPACDHNPLPCDNPTP